MPCQELVLDQQVEIAMLSHVVAYQVESLRMFLRHLLSRVGRPVFALNVELRNMKVVVKVTTRELVKLQWTKQLLQLKD